MKRGRCCAIATGLCLLISACATTPDPPAGFTTITLERPVHFTAPDGSDNVAAPGEYSVRVAEETLLSLVPAQGGTGNKPLLLQTQPMSHEESLTSEVALAIPQGEDEQHVVLLLPDGRGLDAAGSLTGVRSRATIANLSPMIIKQYTYTKLPPRTSGMVLRPPNLAGCMPANYPILTESVSPDLRTVYLVSNGAVDGSGNPGTWQPTGGGPSQILARRVVGANCDSARLRLGDITKLASIGTPRPVINPTTGTVYLAVYGAQNTAAATSNQPSFPVMVLEINGTSLQVNRTLAYKPFKVTTPQVNSEAPDVPRYLFMSPAWNAAYTIGMYPSPFDAGTEGSIAWSDLQAFVHNGTKYIQDVVETSGVRAAETASSWKFLNANPHWIPGTNHVLMSGYNTQTGVFPGLLEGALNPASGFWPSRTLPYPGKPLGFIGDRLYVVQVGGIRSLPKSQLDTTPTFHLNLPTIEFMEDGRQRRVSFTVGDSYVSSATGQILFGGPDGLFIYNVATNTGTLDTSMILHPTTTGTTRTSKVIRAIHGGTVSRKVLLRIDTMTSPAAGGMATTTTQYMSYTH
jgi:hypothetical protein